MIQKAMLFGLFLLGGVITVCSQDQYATIDLSDFWVDSISYISYGEADTDKVLFNATVGTLTSFKVQLLEGYNTNVHLNLSLAVGLSTYRIELDNGQLLDENSTAIYTSSISDLDEFYLAIGGDQLYYYFNSTLLQQKTITSSTSVAADLESFFDLNAKVYFYQEGGGIAETGDFAGFIHKPDTFPINQCSPDDFYIGIPQVSINIENLTTSSFTTVTSNSIGNYTAALSPGMLRIIPSRDYDDTAINGLTILDALLIQLHGDQISLLDCPIKRIASDTNFDGQIDSTDADVVSELILGNEDTLNGPIWRYIPKPYVYPSTGHPDYTFVNNFWSSSFDNPQGFQYPFAASLKFNGKTYHYGGANSWMEKVHEWPFGSEDACGETNWGFYTIKVGDVNDNLDIGTIQNFTSGGEVLNLRVSSGSSPRSLNRLSSRSAGRYKVRIIAKSRQPIQCYQLGLRVDVRQLEILQVTPERERLAQTEARNFGNRRGQFNEGIIRHLWLSKTAFNSADFQGERGQMLFEFEVQTLGEVQLSPTNLSEFIYLDPSILPTLFYNNGQVDRGIELQIELEEL